MATREIIPSEIPEDLKKTFGLEQAAVESIDKEITDEVANRIFTSKKYTGYFGTRGEKGSTLVSPLTVVNINSDQTQKDSRYFEKRDTLEEVDLAKIPAGTLFRSSVSEISLELLGLETVNEVKKVKIRQYPIPEGRNPNEYGLYDMEKFKERYVYKAEQNPLYTLPPRLST